MFKLEFKTGNAVFMDEDGNENREIERMECAVLLRSIANRLDNGDEYGKVIDRNGNGIGVFELT